VGNVVVWIVWVVAAFACISSGIAVVSFSNPFYSALALIGNLASLAALYLLLSAEFVAAGQVLVYAGAVMVMFLFVTAYLGGRADAPWAGGPTWQQIGGVLAAGAILVEVIVVIGLKAGGKLSHEAKIESGFGSRLRDPRRARACPRRARGAGEGGRCRDLMSPGTSLSRPSCSRPGPSACCSAAAR